MDGIVRTQTGVVDPYPNDERAVGGSFVMGYEVYAVETEVLVLVTTRYQVFIRFTIITFHKIRNE